MSLEQAPPQPGDTLVAAALCCIKQPDPALKAAFTQTAVDLWQSGRISRVCDGPLAASQIPDRPSRQRDKVQLVAPGAMPKLGKGGTLASRQAILHSLVHIELAAVDLSWDIIVRFGTTPSYRLPKAFFDDFVQVAADEASHFSMLKQRLEAVGSHYGALPAHDGLWESAQTTAHSLPARLAVEHCVHEARGLDVLPSTVHKFRSNKDAESAALLEDVIYAEEISHCAAGVRWLKYLFELAHSLPSPTKQQQQPAEQPAEQPPQQQQQQQPQELGQQLPQQQQQRAEQQPEPQPEQPPPEQPPQELGQQLEPQPEQPPSEQQELGQQLEQLQLQQHAAEQPAAGAAAPAAAHGHSNGCCCSAAAAAVVTESHDWVADAQQHSSVESWFHSLIRRHFKGSLKPPFNEAARAQAGFGPEWYLPLAAAQPH